jgi:hypothetical protein
MFLHCVRIAWDEYFPGSSPSQTFATTEYTKVHSSSSTNVFVSNCLFNGCTSTSGDGGALYCSSSVQHFLVESSSFFSCSTSSSSGGAIYFSSGGECVLNKVCGNNCFSTSTSGSYGQFAAIYVQHTASNKNYVNYSSASRCLNHNSNSYITLRLQYGKTYCQSVNSSLNKCQYYSGIFFYSYADSNSVTCLLLYSSFTDNIDTGFNCIYQEGTAAKAEMKYCNVIRNLQVISDSFATIRFYGNSIVTDSCILLNNATYTFYSSSSYTITVSNCTMDSTKYQNNVVFTNTAIKSFIHALNHISTKNCYSEYDSAGILTVLSIPTNKAFRCSCNCQSRIGDLFSLTYLFIITFIYSESSF